MSEAARRTMQELAAARELARREKVRRAVCRLADRINILVARAAKLPDEPQGA